MNISVRFEPRDLRVGAYWDESRVLIGEERPCPGGNWVERRYVACPLPCLQIIFAYTYFKPRPPVPPLPLRDTSRDWPEDKVADPDNGNYWNTCVLCASEFIGHKRRTVCKMCHLTQNAKQLWPL